MKAVILILTGSFVFMTGCATNGQAFSPVENPDVNKAVVYIYRPFNVVACCLNPHVYIDEVKYGPLKNNAYLVYFVKPGKCMIELRDAMFDENMTIYPDLAAGNEYYIRWSIETQLTSHVYKFEVVPKEYAIEEIKLTKKAD